MRIEAEAVLFDNDGVLVDSHAPTGAGWRRICDAYGMDFVEVSAQLAGVRAIDTLARFLPADQVDEAFARLEQFEIDESDGVVAIPGALDLVAALPAGRWTIVTSATPPLAEVRWRHAGITPPVPHITADDVERGKPHPDPFLAGAEALGVDPTRCVVFEDSPSGGAAGAAAGATVIAVGDQPWEFTPAARVPDLRSARVVAPDSNDAAAPIVLEIDAD
ncbi:MAG: HAD-IA family hydrolase [Acidimicrobiales bacterium]